jgi:hypothetical protein
MYTAGCSVDGRTGAGMRSAPHEAIHNPIDSGIDEG